MKYWMDFGSFFAELLHGMIITYTQKTFFNLLFVHNSVFYGDQILIWLFVFTI